MLYILEGPDGSGKTTLANKICEVTGFPYMHAGKYRGKPEDVREWFRRVMAAAAHEEHLVLDRSLVISDTIYNVIIRDQCVSLNDEHLIYMKSFLRDLHKLGSVRWIACCGVTTDLITSEKDDEPTMEHRIKESYVQLKSAYLQLTHEISFSNICPIWWYMPDLGCDAETYVTAWVNRRNNFHSRR